MRTPILAALAAFALLPASAALADAANAHAWKAERAMRATDGSALFVMTGRTGPSKPAIQAAASRRLVYIDGVLVEMAEEMIRGQIEAGVFTIVYPGTSIPWNPGDDRHPNYPPTWF